VPGVYTVLLEGRSYDAFVEATPDGLIVTINGNRFEVDVRDPRRLSRRSPGAGGAGVQTLSSPMPGKVVRVLVAVGDTVAAGQGVLVIEAMKMQNELKATRAGTVLSVSAKEGATVVAGEALATIG
jgi:biotin carboxyl carrier protein